jgi:hypothetical protein
MIIVSTAKLFTFFHVDQLHFETWDQPSTHGVNVFTNDM